MKFASDSPDLVHFKMPLDFIRARTTLDVCELAWGYQRGWLTGEEVVQLCLEGLNAGRDLTPTEEDIALILPADVGQVVPALLEDGARTCSQEQGYRVWLFLILDYVHEHEADFSDTFETIECVAADFQFPDEIAGLLRFTPTPPGERGSLEAVRRRWEEFLDRRGLEFRRRRS